MTEKRAQPAIVKTLLRWYGAHRRDLPWRSAPGEAADPYRVWLSEIMLQQTTVAAATPYYERFVARWPDVAALARAPREDVLAAWAGLGYYARARNLHACASRVVEEFGGRFPADEKTLLTLPGIGHYTAAAIAAIAFGRRASPVDGNIERVMARLFAVATPLPAAKKRLSELAKAATPAKRAGDFAQALMDLGATICKPRSPACPTCPLWRPCLARKAGFAENLPKRPAKAPKPKRFAVAFVIQNKDLKILLRKRNEKGLLGGMTEIPTTPWTGNPWSKKAALAQAPVNASWQVIHRNISHTFTHFELEIKVMWAKIETPIQPEGFWIAPKDLRAQALPSVMRKIIGHALDAPAVKSKTGRAPAGRL